MIQKTFSSRYRIRTILAHHMNVAHNDGAAISDDWATSSYEYSYHFYFHLNDRPFLQCHNIFHMAPMVFVWSNPQSDPETKRNENHIATDLFAFHPKWFYYFLVDIVTFFGCISRIWWKYVAFVSIFFFCRIFLLIPSHKRFMFAYSFLSNIARYHFVRNHIPIVRMLCGCVRALRGFELIFLFFLSSNCGVCRCCIAFKSTTFWFFLPVLSLHWIE